MATLPTETGSHAQAKRPRRQPGETMESWRGRRRAHEAKLGGAMPEGDGPDLATRVARIERALATGDFSELLKGLKT